MTEIETMAEIRDANLSYLMLAQQMIHADLPSAIFRLGISGEVANLLKSLSNSQLLKLASSSMMLARFRFQDSAILSMLTNYSRDRDLNNAQAVVLMAGQAVEEFV